MLKHKYTISASINDGQYSDDSTAVSLTQAKVELKKIKDRHLKAIRCGNFKKGEVIEYSITKWTIDEDGELENIVDDVYYKRIEL